MGGMVKALMGGSSDSSAQQLQLARQQQELTQIAQSRSAQTAADSAAEAAGQLVGVKTVRGQRLLLSKEKGGLASTLGTA